MPPTLARPGDGVEVAIAGVQYEVVLQDECRSPDVVGRIRRALPARGAADSGIVKRRLLIGEEDAHVVALEKAPRHTLVVREAAPEGEPLRRIRRWFEERPV